MDYASYTVALVAITANNDTLYLTDHHEALTIDDEIYLSCPSMEFDLPEETGDFSDTEGTIKKLKDTFTVMDQLAGGYPYNNTTIKVSEVSLDDDLEVLTTHVLFKGRVYSSTRSLGSGYVELTIRNMKYYTGMTGGVPCTEDCAVKYFGDSVCKKSVSSEVVEITVISGTEITVDPEPSGVDFLYNKGYVEYDGVNVKIQYWESGDTIQTKRPVPGDWIGQEVTIYAGCDRSIETCRDIHDNEENFLGLGASMVDYDPRIERY